MTDKELKYLKRIDLLDIMIAQDKEIEQLKKRLEETEKRANLAEAVIQRFLSGEQNAAEQAETLPDAEKNAAESAGVQEAEKTAEPADVPEEEKTAESAAVPEETL